MQPDPTKARKLHEGILELSDRIAAHAKLIREAAHHMRPIDEELIEENRRLIEELNGVVKELSEASDFSDQRRSANGSHAS